MFITKMNGKEAFIDGMKNVKFLLQKINYY